MKTTVKIMLFALCLVAAMSSLASCDDILGKDDEESADALGRVANESIYDLEDIEYGDVEIGDCKADKTTDYVGIPLTSERLKFGVDGFSGSVETDRFDAPEKGKKYTVEITSYTSEYYNTITFYYEWFEDGDMRRSASAKEVLFEMQLQE